MQNNTELQTIIEKLVARVRETSSIFEANKIAAYLDLADLHEQTWLDSNVIRVYRNGEMIEEHRAENLESRPFFYVDYESETDTLIDYMNAKGMSDCLVIDDHGDILFPVQNVQLF